MNNDFIVLLIPTGVFLLLIEEFGNYFIHYLGDKQDFDVLSEGPSSGTSKGNSTRNVEILFIA